MSHDFRGRPFRALLLSVSVALAAAWWPQPAHTQAAPSAAQPAGRPALSTALPNGLSDADFWALERDISEPGGFFQITDNYTSNELEIGELFTRLRETGVQGGVYIGVGPEQNLTYIAAVRPQMAFVIDIRRQAVVQHLMFKAILELAKDRADFISLLFAKPRPEGLTDATSIQDMWDAFSRVDTSREAAAVNAARVTERLTKTHGFTLTEDESGQLERVLDAFVEYGPSISTRGAPGGRGGGNGASFADLTGWSRDLSGKPQSFLSTEDNFRYVKALQEQNLIVPVSGDFGGPKALRAIGSYLKAHGAAVSAFYVSNVEQYLFQDRKEQAFFDNVAALPLTEKTVFIRPYSLRRASSAASALCPVREFLEAVREGRVRTNNDALACGR